MGFLDALRRKPAEDEYYDDYENSYDSYDNSYDSYDNYDYEDSYAPRESEPQGVAGVQPIHSIADMEIVISAPAEYKDAVVVADYVRDMKFVVLNLNKMEAKVASRLLDFLSGVAYSENSHVTRIATNTYVIVPYFVDVVGSY